MTIALAIGMILATTVHLYVVNYGYYVPHWTYQGWGGPTYWKKLTNNEDDQMSTYNNKRKSEWTVPDNETAEYIDHNGNCKAGMECVSYSICEKGKYQSPININAWSWKNESQNANSQYRNAKDKTLGELFTPDIKTKFVPVYYHEKLKFHCKSENTTEYKCGMFKWKDRKYKLKYFKIHTPSEHTFDNIKNGMEIQFVMEEKNVDEGKEQTLALAVLFNIGMTNSSSIRAIDKIFGNSTFDQLTGHNKYKNLQDAKRGNRKAYIALGKNKTNKSSLNATGKVNLGDIIHAKSSFFHYKGSDTSPPCNEGSDGKGMDWFIQKDIVHMTEEQWRGIYDFFTYPGNSRPTTDIDLNPERIVTFYGDVNSINTITRFAPLKQ